MRWRSVVGLSVGRFSRLDSGSYFASRFKFETTVVPLWPANTIPVSYFCCRRAWHPTTCSHELQSWSLISIPMKENHWNKGNLCTRSGNNSFLSLFPGWTLIYSICCLCSSLLNTVHILVFTGRVQTVIMLPVRAVINSTRCESEKRAIRSRYSSSCFVSNRGPDGVI